MSHTQGPLKAGSTATVTASIRNTESCETSDVVSSGDNVTDPDGPQGDQENCDVADLCANTDIELEDPQGESSSDHDTSQETIGYCFDEVKQNFR